AAAICVLILDFQISVQTERRLELCVGAMLFLLGLNVLRKLLQGGNLSFRRHGHGNLDHAHPYVHAFGNEETEPHTHHDLSFSPRASIIGMVHGLAAARRRINESKRRFDFNSRRHQSSAARRDDDRAEMHRRLERDL
ncbi:MAG TPA: hypothetical protein VNI84_15415, partial [Pyrinomonadaceae bacterium]|nr:hypothetical protein [Pyrinomonadaceae bacterium]